jgi:GNAT superfamily N-acetyltransferase
MSIEILPFDPKTASREEWDRFHRFRRLRHEETDPGDPILSDDATEKLMKRPDPYGEPLYFAVVDSERPDEQIGALYFEVVREGTPDYGTNKHLAWTYPEVITAHRRRGIGRLLLAEAARLARERHRALIVTGSDEADGKAFIGAIGAKVAQRTRESRLYLGRVDWRMVERWAEEGALRSPDTTLHFFKNHIPDAIMEEFSATLTEVFNQMPRDELDIGDEIMTPERIRQWEARFEDTGGTRLSAITQEADGEISGLTEMGYFPDKETFINQYMTGVKQKHRGRGLGKWLKAAMLLRIREEFPQVRVVVTGNATSNAAMLSINERLGFKPHKEGIVAQITLEALERYLGR